MIALVVLAALQTGATPAAEPRVKVTGHDFIVQATDGSGRRAELRTDRVPNRAGICYRWSLRVKPEARIATIEERLQLPAGAPAWNVQAGSTTVVAPDGRSALTTLRLPLALGEISNSWCVADGDPDGHHSITVSAGGRVLHRFDFVVGEEPTT
ncbi:hypothetical protein GGR88_001463 [Sphingomonas jejuensis]|uniref:Uncharacterized protein n=1 Tax=Sphingomonas jejuensis TaxID=904715 RepID=A0ABX0XKW2_9SPHN|nr:hypothetical protein [Sphingomonas jejuensis]NJC33989.1 hypothetical protein [Sphingomonas jejuensis]